MLAFRNRFHGYSTLKYVYKNGKSVRTQHLTLKYSKNPHRKLSRYAVVVSKKIIKGAVGRNRIRRRVFEAIRDDLPYLAEPYDVVCIVASAELRDIDSSELREIISRAFSESGLYK
ncbi:MAG: ribonuclease P protein component [Candidatus Saccharimonadales bacterium]